MGVGLAVLALLQAGQPNGSVGRDASMMKPGERYEAGGLHRFFFGDSWRSLWATPIRVPVANLDKLAGGLTAEEKGGSGQTRTLRFRATDGRHYHFRSLDKTPMRQSDGLKRNPLFLWIAQDHISSIMPANGVAVSRLEQAAGLIPTERQLVVLPDSPRLGEWRDEFKGMLGTLERRYTKDEKRFPEIPGAVELVSTDSLLERLASDRASWVDQRAYLAARFFDFIVGDADRWEDQWSWVRFDQRGLAWWKPLPRDRDWALSHSDGVFWSLVRIYYPTWDKFGPRYGSLSGLTRKSAFMDHYLLTGLDRRTWDSVAAALRARLSDRAIQAAVEALPKEFDAGSKQYLVTSLKGRRDRLPELVGSYYRGLARVVDVRGTSGAEQATATRDPDGGLLLELRTATGATAFRRRFLPEETSEIRLYLLGGADTLRIRGAAGGIPLRVITGGGADLVTDSTGGDGLRVYDDSSSATVLATGSVEYRTGRQIANPERDYGTRLGIVPWLRVRPELGFVLGGGPVFYTYSFRKDPYASRVGVRLASTTGMGQLNVDVDADFRFENSRRRFLVEAGALNADVIRFFGFGNETGRVTEPGFHNVTMKRYFLEPTLEFGTGRALSYGVGGVLQWSEPDRRHPTLLELEDPYGAGSFVEAGATAFVRYDTRDSERLPTRGVTLTLTGRAFPAALDVESPFGSAAVEGTSYLTAGGLPLQPTLALRAGGMQTVGTYPYMEAAAIGGRRSFRGLTTRRLSGDAAVYGNAELRLNLGDLTGGEWGVFGLTDVGRVYFEGEDSSKWWKAFGGGAWVAFSNRRHVLTATLATGGEALRFYLHTGFHF